MFGSKHKGIHGKAQPMHITGYVACGTHDDSADVCVLELGACGEQLRVWFSIAFILAAIALRDLARRPSQLWEKAMYSVKRIFTLASMDVNRHVNREKQTCASHSMVAYMCTRSNHTTDYYYDSRRRIIQIWDLTVCRSSLSHVCHDRNIRFVGTKQPRLNLRTIVCDCSGHTGKNAVMQQSWLAFEERTGESLEDVRAIDAVLLLARDASRRLLYCREPWFRTLFVSLFKFVATVFNHTLQKPDDLVWSRHPPDGARTVFKYGRGSVTRPRAVTQHQALSDF